jgi:PAS domain S-box-containing protein
MILEDSPEDRRLYWSYLNQDRVVTYNVIEADTGSQALTELLKTTPDLILIKNQLPDMDVWQFRHHLESVNLDIPIIIIAENEDATLAVEAMKNGVQDYIFKSKITASGLCRAVHRVLEKTQLLKQIIIQQQQQQLLARISLRIRQFLGLAEILQIAVEEVQKFLLADRVIVYKFAPEMNGQIVAESLIHCQNFFKIQIQDHSFPETQIINYSQEKIRAIADIENDFTRENHIKIPAPCQIKAYLTVPILLNREILGNATEYNQNNNYLWGLLIAHQCSNTRDWQQHELDLLEQICVQLGVAIQQAELYENLRHININLEEKIQEKTEQLRDSERRFRAIFNNSFHFTGLLTTAGIVLEANQTALNFARLQLEDVINRPFWETYWWQKSPKTQEQLKQAIARAAQGEFIRYEVDVLGAEDQTATIDFSLYPLKDETGKVVMLIPEGRDITDKNRLERECQNVLAALQNSEAELRGLFQAMEDVILILDQQGRYLKIAPTGAEEKLYQSAAELLGKTVREIFPSHLADFFISIIEQTLTTQQSSECEYSLKIGKKEIWFSAKVSPISTDTVIWAARDITKAKHNEIIQKNADKALQEHQLLLQVVMDGLPMAIFWKDKNSRFLGCNHQLLLDAGLSTTAEIIGKTDFDMIWREQAPLYQADDRAVIESGQPKFNIEEPFTKTGNQNRYLRTNKIPLQNPEGEIIGVLGSYEDITESKKIEQALRESERRYATLTQSAPVGIYRTDASGNCLYVNPHWCEISGLTPQEAAGNGWEKALHPNDQQLIATEWELLVTTGKIFSLEYRFRRPDGSESWVFGQAVPEKDSAGKIIGYVGTITDISSRKQAEKALRRSEQLYRTLVDNFPGGIVVLFDHDLRYLLVGGKGLESAGFKKAEMQGKTVWEIFPLEVSEIIAPVFRQTLAGETVILEIPFFDRLYLTHHIPVTDDQGNIIAGILMSQDITERKKAEQERDRFLQMLEAQNQTLESQIAERTAELQESKERFRNLVETSSDWVWEVNEFGFYTYSSPQIINVLGYTPEEILGKTPFDLMPKAEAERVLQEFMKYVSVQAPFQCLENTNLHKDGREIILETSAVPIFDEDKQFRGYRGMDRDITARKASEVALRQSEARFQRIAANLPGAIYQYVLHADGSHEFLYMSDQCREIYEVESASALANAENIFKLTYPEDVPSLQTSIILSANSLQKWSWEGRMITPSGTMKWIHGISQPEKLDNGDILWDGLVFDISDRKQTEIALSNLSDRLNLAIKSAQIGIWDWDIVNNHLVWDDRMYELYGIKPSDFTGAYPAWEAALHPDDLPFGRTVVQQALAGEKDFELEFRVIWPDGTIRFIQAYALVQRDHQGKAQRMIGINFDITENKQSEAKLQEAKIQLRNLSDRLKLAVTSAKIGIWDFDLVNDSLIWDEQMYKLFGVSPINFNPSQGAWSKFEQLLHPDDQITSREIVQTVIAENQELDTEFRVIWPDGKIRILKAYGMVQRNSQGIPQRMIGINYDISDRRQEEIENKRLKERLQFVLSASPAIIYTCQAYGNFAATFISNNVEDILGYTTKEYLEDPNFWLDHIHPQDLSLVIAELSQLGNKESHSYQYRFCHQNGNYIWVEDEFRLVRDKTGKPIEIIGYVVDISDEKAALHERELAEAEIIRSRDLREAIFNESADAIFSRYRNS